MPVLCERCAGLDVPKKTVVAWVVTPTGQETRTCRTMTVDVLALSDGPVAYGCTHVAMESTGDSWKPVFHMREGTCEVLLVNAQHVKAVPGRKPDVNDAAWLAELLQHGLWRASFIPPVAQWELRDLTRYRSTVIRERVPLINRVQKRLEAAHIKLAAVAAASLRVSGRARLAALRAGHTDPPALADLAKGRLRAKRELLAQALDGRVQPHHRVVLTERWCQLGRLDETMARCDTQIQAISPPFEAALGQLETLPGVAHPTAEMLGAEIGTDMSRFPRADHLASWPGVAPGHHDRAGKRTAGKTRQGHRFLRTVLVRAAHAAARTQGTYLSAQYRRLATRRGKKRAMMAGAHSMLVMAYHMLQRQEPYREAVADFFDRRHPEDTARRLAKRLEHLGYHVILQSSSTEDLKLMIITLDTLQGQSSIHKPSLL